MIKYARIFWNILIENTPSSPSANLRYKRKNSNELFYVTNQNPKHGTSDSCHARMSRANVMRCCETVLDKRREVRSKCFGYTTMYDQRMCSFVLRVLMQPNTGNSLEKKCHPVTEQWNRANSNHRELVDLISVDPFFSIYLLSGDQYQYLGNCPPTPPLTQQQSIDSKLELLLG